MKLSLKFLIGAIIGFVIILIPIGNGEHVGDLIAKHVLNPILNPLVKPYVEGYRDYDHYYNFSPSVKYSFHPV